MQANKYKLLLDESINWYGMTLYRIQALRDFGNVKAGDRGGYVERETNLSHHGNCWIGGDAKIGGNAKIGGDAKVESSRDYIVFKNWWSSGRYFTWTRSDNMWAVGCFRSTGDELIAKAYKDSELSGREYERIVKYVESILQEQNNTTNTK